VESTTTATKASCYSSTVKPTGDSRTTSSIATYRTAIAVACRAAITTADVPTIAVTATTIVSAVVPGTGSDEDAARKPVRAVVAIRGAAIGSIRIVPIGTGRGTYRYSDTNAKRNLSVRLRGWGHKEGECCNES
jgi:hypothetical protein